jgi:hypothetical protein
MKMSDRVSATCLAAGAVIVFIFWFAWDLPLHGLGLGSVVGLILYRILIRQVDHQATEYRQYWAYRNPDRGEEPQPFGRPSE